VAQHDLRYGQADFGQASEATQAKAFLEDPQHDPNAHEDQERTIQTSGPAKRSVTKNTGSVTYTKACHTRTSP